MSIDINIQDHCDHYINWERLTFEQDQQTVYPTYMVGSVASSFVRINNNIIDPKDYVISKNAEGSAVNRSFMVFFRAKNRLWDPLVEMKYMTPSTYCPKCGAENLINDVMYGKSGDFKMMSKESLLVQNVEKYIVTEVGSNFFHSWMGTSLISLVGTKIIDKDLLLQQITDQVTQALEKLKSIQSQLQATGRTMDPGELFGKLYSVTVNQTDDPTLFNVTVNFTAQSGNPLSYTQYLEFSELRRKVLQ